MHFGIRDFEDDLNKNVYDRLKKQFKILEPKFDAIFKT